MIKPDAQDATLIVQNCCDHLIKTVAQTGRTGSDARQQIAWTRVYAYRLLWADIIGPELDSCFALAVQAGATLAQMEAVRRNTALETPQTLGGALIQNSLIQWCLAMESLIIANMTFDSRSDVDQIKAMMQTPFEDAEEQAADDMVQAVYQALVALHGSVVMHLCDVARPLPSMLNYQFAAPSNTLVIAYRLYSDSTRADQVRNENKIIHPAFAPARGQALSS
jgi:prophage DNA circulation protein